MNGEPDIVKNFLLKTLLLQGWEKRIDRFKLGEGAMPANFKVLKDPKRGVDTLAADFGESAIGRVAPADSGLWWIILLRAYTKSTGDLTLAETPECQKGIRLIMNQCLAEGFDTFPTLLCADGCCMIDRRMGVYGYPIEIQALFFMALRCALLLLKPEGEGNKDIVERIVTRLHVLSYHMRAYFWLDFQQLTSSTASRRRSTPTRPSTSSTSARSPSRTGSSTSCPPREATSSATSAPPGWTSAGSRSGTASPSSPRPTRPPPSWTSSRSAGRTSSARCRSRSATPLSRATSGSPSPAATPRTPDGATTMVAPGQCSCGS